MHLRKSKWKSVIGLEIHAQILSKSKLFSGSSTKYGAPVNTQVSFFDAALPGTLPVLNRRCVEAGVLTAMALNSKINKISKFDRKHYFYADLPSGYQITQQRQPLAVGGELAYVNFNPSVHKQPIKKKAKLVQIQLEQDSGKSLHDLEEKQSLIDLNRAGTGLMEIVTEPDFTSGEEAASFVKELQLILQSIGTCDGKMSEGSLRVDANISIHQEGESLGTRTEVKNINSIRGIAKAIEFEIKRQISEKESGRQIVNETRTFDAESGETLPMRDKEKILDYRFMPEPNLPPVHVYDSVGPGVSVEHVVIINQLKEQLQELPEEKRRRVQKQYGLPLNTAVILVNEPGLLSFFEEVLQDSKRDPVAVVTILVNEFLGQIHSREITVTNSPVSAVSFGELCDMLSSEKISLSTAKKVLALMFEKPESRPQDIVSEKNWLQVSDTKLIEETCRNVLTNSPKLVTEYKKGKKKVLNALIGQIQKDFQGRANPRLVIETLQRLIDSEM
ncbi:glutamyl-tRNA(Gln) amidotransferase subunit B, mitochondrial-like isoform X2 [Gigantopelta aegis]|uniref:glutamyl-tRNA(Gln) amidotransferase subunit B, mitochondrial-like isoform X2 n=1 Tax=Gigantopelta aegis TaxID=1735272 RepID=UPI001B888C2F|nr:glutamyl-tRNA(Gln) amidotransferase subunit B, mitochondrial-like isoform X2 [Gigantopelta aegis]